MLSGHKYDQYPLGFSRLTEALGGIERSEEHSEGAEVIMF